MLSNIPYILFSRDHNENKAFKALFCVIPAITSQLVFNFLTDLFLLDIVIICSTDSVTFYLWRNIPTYLPTFMQVSCPPVLLVISASTTSHLLSPKSEQIVKTMINFFIKMKYLSSKKKFWEILISILLFEETRNIYCTQPCLILAKMNNSTLSMLFLIFRNWPTLYQTYTYNPIKAGIEI